jgi:hypothetical protein
MAMHNRVIGGVSNPSVMYARGARPVICILRLLFCQFVYLLFSFFLTVSVIFTDVHELKI